MFNNLVEKVKAFAYKSWTIFLSYVEIFIGAVTGIVAAIDWSGLTSIDFGSGLSNTQLALIAGGFILRGIVGYIARIRNTVVAPTNQLVPANLVGKKVTKAN